MKKDYYIGLDLGTGSLGWAVTDKEYQLIRRHGKTLWGVRLFETANTAEARRTFRTSRRRLARRNWRLGLLQEIFAEEINKVDPGFYLRMKESRYVPEDKQDHNGERPDLPYALFVDRNYTDKDYHKQFPTIYHLRKWLMETDATPDIRLVYLAFHHMVKHRGHFLLSGDLGEIEKFETVFLQFVECVQGEELDYHLPVDPESVNRIEQILKDSKMIKSDKKKELFKALNTSTPCEKALITLISGGTAKLSDIFGEKDLNESERPKLSFADYTYDEYADSINAVLGERYTVIEMAKAVYDWALLADILAGSKSLSTAKVAVYEKHKHDLSYLKKIVREKAGKEVYREVFVKTEDKLANYCAYAGISKKNGRKQELQGKRCSKEDFYAFLKKRVIPLLGEIPEADYIKTEMERGTFLPKQVTKDNSVLPYQLHLYEMNRIFENLKDRIPLLAEEENQIRSLLTFRIPYYVGPLNGIRRGETTTNWAERKQPGKIYPWNFEEMIDLEQCAERFIRRMTSKCTYLMQEDVLPKNSLLYSRFMVLNELNNLRLNGEPIDVELKQHIYRDLFERYRKVTQKKLKNYLICEGIIDRAQAESLDIGGIDGDFKSSLTAYHDFKEKLTGCSLSEKEKEGVILNITLFGEDRKLLGKRLKKLCPALSEKQIQRLCKLSYQGWGRLSEKFLDGIYAPDPETGEKWNIIRALWETNDNLMQLLSEKYHFTDAIEDENGLNEINAFSYERVEELRVSPAVKRQIWQTILIVRELCKAMEGEPKRVFVEMARGEETAEEKRRNQSMRDSRRKRLIELYKKCREEEGQWIEELEGTDNGSLRSDKLYLYYTQKGRCMYSGEVIRLEDLWDNRKYDIDHIYPQSKVMDDSLDNRVLVKKEENEAKSDSYPIRSDIREARKPFWKALLDGGFITKEKYNRLTRGTEFTQQELAGFIARQLVETRQGTRAVASILKQLLPETEIVYVKAGIVSQFRQDFDLFKVREMNDLHHAKDAYLNIVAGNGYYVKFTGNALRYIRENSGRSYNLKKMFTSEHDIKWGKEIAWKAGEGGTIHTVKKVMEKNNILVTRRSYQAKGELFDQQLMKKGRGQVPVKGGDARLQNIEQYGGYNKASGAYFVLVESADKKGRRIRSLEYVPVYLQKRLENEEEMKQFLIKDQGLKEPRILLPRIKIDTLFSVDGFYMWLSGRTGDQLIFKGANQLILSRADAKTLKAVLNFVRRKSENKEIIITARDGIEPEPILKLYDAFLDKLQHTVYGKRLRTQTKTLTAKRDNFSGLSLENQCIVISEILHMFQCKSGASDLRLIGGPGSAGILVMNKEISKNEKISIVNQSPTGIYETEIDLKAI